MTLNPQQFVPATVHMEWADVPDAAEDTVWESMRFAVCTDCAPTVMKRMEGLGQRPSKIEMHRTGVDPTHYCEEHHPGGLR